MKATIQTLKKAALPLVLTSPILRAQIAENSPLELAPAIVTGSAQEDSEEIPKDQQVTAYKTGTPLQDVPQSVTIFTADQIEKQGIDSMGDLVDYTPGVTNSQGEGHRDAIVFRGVRSTADFFADGVRDDVQYYRSLYNVDQVEILKGPNSLTFGRGGIGGVLNRSFKRAEISQDFTRTQGNIDTFGATNTQLDHNHSIADWAAFRLNTHYDSLANHRDLYEGERIGVNPTFTFKIAEDTELRFAYEYADHNRFIDRGIPSTPDGRVAEQFVEITFGDSELNLSELEAHTFRLSLDHRINDNWKGSMDAFYGTYDKVYSNYFLTGFDGGNEVELDGYLDRADRQRLSLAGDLIGEFSTGSLEHKVLLGGEYLHTTSAQDRLNNVWASNGDDRQVFDVSNGFTLSNGVFRSGSGAIQDAGAMSQLNDDTSSTLNVFSIFIQDEIALNDHWDFILGARFDSFDIEVIDYDPEGDGIRNGAQTLSRTDTTITPRLGLVFKPVQELSLYGSYSESFLPRSGEQFADLGSGSDALDPDRASNLEVGVKWDLVDNLSLVLSGFRIDQTTTDNDTFNPGALVEIDSQIYGAELQLKGQLTDRWFVSTGYSFLEGEQNSQDPSLDGRRLRELPKHSLSFWNNFKITEDLSLGFGVIYQDKSFVDDLNTITLPSYVRVDAFARYDISENFAVQVNMENVLDKEYFPNAHSNDDITVGPPLSARIGFIGRF